MFDHLMALVPRAAMKRTIHIILLLGFLLVSSLSIVKAQPDTDSSGNSSPFSFGHTKAKTCASTWLIMDRLIDKNKTRCKQLYRISGFPYLRGTRAVLEMARKIGGKYAEHEWLELLRRIDLQARYVELSQLPGPEMVKFCKNAGIECFQGRIRAYVARCSAIIMGDEKCNHGFMHKLKKQAISALSQPVHGSMVCFEDEESLDGLLTADVLQGILSPFGNTHIRSTSYLEKRISGNKKIQRP